MMRAGDASSRDHGRVSGGDPFDLERFVSAQRSHYATALAELRAGSKRTHWMWFVFPQVLGLGTSSTSTHYAIRSSEEARCYLDHHVLGPRLRECAEVLLTVHGRTASAIFGYPDDVKLKSSMTLFTELEGTGSVFERVLAKYYAGRRCERTLELLRRAAPGS